MYGTLANDTLRSLSLTGVMVGVGVVMTVGLGVVTTVVGVVGVGVGVVGVVVGVGAGGNVKK
jgi:hypothetical protein